MNIPNWYEAALLALAAWRIFQLVSEDDILDRPRTWVLLKLPGKWDEFVECPYCAGFWITAAWWGAWQIWPFGTLVAASLFAIHALMIGAYKVLVPE